MCQMASAANGKSRLRLARIPEIATAERAKWRTSRGPDTTTKKKIDARSHVG
jgi:hypothetical protein